jgi:hypothetical protein
MNEERRTGLLLGHTEHIQALDIVNFYYIHVGTIKVTWQVYAGTINVTWQVYPVA